MKILNVVVVSMSLVFAQLSAAAPTKAKPAAAVPASIALNPETIETQVLRSNTSILDAMNAVHQAKDEVNIARGNLLPSLNLTALLSFSPGGFMLASIDFLVPFLIPSNWANYFTQKNLFEAEKLSYNVVELNTYSSALSLYFTTLSDRQVQEIYQQEYLDLQQIFELQKQKNGVGTVPIADLLQTQAQAQMAGVKASQLSELNQQEIASLRKAMALNVNTAMTLDFVDMAASPWEYQTLQTTIDKANAVSLEAQQLRYMYRAAQDQVWSKAFGWISNVSVGSTGSASGGASFAHMAATGSINLGFALYPTIQLSQDQAKEILIQEQTLSLENTRVVESAINSLIEAKQQLDLATQAETEMAHVYQIKAQDYDQGTETLTNVLLARNQLADASIAKIKANSDVNLQRVLLHRILLSAQFSTVPTCHAVRMPTEQKVGIIGRIFGPKDPPKYPTLDAVCHGK